MTWTDAQCVCFLILGESVIATQRAFRPISCCIGMVLFQKETSYCYRFKILLGVYKSSLGFVFAKTHTHQVFYIYIYIYICVCVCVRERERERETGMTESKSTNFRSPPWNNSILFHSLKYRDIAPYFYA